MPFLPSQNERVVWQRELSIMNISENMSGDRDCRQRSNSSESVLYVTIDAAILGIICGLLLLKLESGAQSVVAFEHCDYIVDRAVFDYFAGRFYQSDKF